MLGAAILATTSDRMSTPPNFVAPAARPVPRERTRVGYTSDAYATATAINELIPQMGTISRMYRRAVRCPLCTRLLGLANTNPNNAAAVSAVIRAMVFLAPQNPYR